MTELFLIVNLAGQWVAVAADQVESVVDIGDIVTVPCVEPSVSGLAALRSRVVTVIDTRCALGFAASETASKRAIITVHDGHYYAVTVDALDDVAPFMRVAVAGVIGSGLVGTSGGWNDVGTGLITRNDEPMLVVDLARLIPAPLGIAV